MVTDILSRIILELSQLIVQILDTVLLSHLLWGIGAMEDVHIRLIGKPGVEFLLVLNKLFC